MYHVIKVSSDTDLSVESLTESYVSYIEEEAKRDNPSLQYMDGKSFFLVEENPVTGKSYISAYCEDEKKKNVILCSLIFGRKGYMETCSSIFNDYRVRDIKEPRRVGNSFQQQIAC